MFTVSVQSLKGCSTLYCSCALLSSTARCCSTIMHSTNN